MTRVNAVGATGQKWKAFERLVAAVNRTLCQGAKVEWDAAIGGRQFDVALRFKMGSYNYLTVIECKDHGRPIPVADVEAFVTKSRDVGADKAVMVAREGFQKGAIGSAARHGVELFTLSKIQEIPPDLLSKELYPALQLYDMRFRVTSSDRWIELPEERNLPEYLAQQLTIRTGEKTRSLHRLCMSGQDRLLSTATPRGQIFSIPLPPETIASFPHLREEYPVSLLKGKFRFASFRVLKAPGFDPFVLGQAYKYANVAKGEEVTIPTVDVKVGFDTSLKPGKFYFNPSLEFSYYCRTLKDGLAYMVLVESYQHGQLIQAEFTQKTVYSGYYAEIDDPKEIDRLRRIGGCVPSPVEIT